MPCFCFQKIVDILFTRNISSGVMNILFQMVKLDEVTNEKCFPRGGGSDKPKPLNKSNSDFVGTKGGLKVCYYLSFHSKYSSFRESPQPQNNTRPRKLKKNLAGFRRLRRTASLKDSQVLG